MTITENTMVAEVASALPSSVRVFQHHHIDFCCGGKIPLGEAARKSGVAYADLAAAIEAAASKPSAGEVDWREAPLPELIDHIVATYHEPLREELPRLEAMAAKVARVHGANAPYLTRLEAVVNALSADLRMHMRKEESVLFPAIRTLSAGDDTRPVDAPITVMEHEHDQAGAMLAELNRLTSGYTVPDWACGTVRAFYNGLSELESEMHLHVHLENNVLFPRALDAGRG